MDDGHGPAAGVVAPAQQLGAVVQEDDCMNDDLIDKLRLLTPEDAMSTYTFNKHLIRHHFCPVCGIHPFGAGSDAKGNAMAAINLRCLEDFDLDAVPVTHFDGRSR